MLAFFFGGAPSSGELILVFLAILLLFGAKRLPDIARNMGKALEEFRRAARDVSDEIMRSDPNRSDRSVSHTLPHGDGDDEASYPGPPEEEEPSPIDDEIDDDDERKPDTPA